MKITSAKTTHQATLVITGSLVGALVVATLVSLFGSIASFDASGLAATSRFLNQFTTVMLTCIALIVPLTSNLYTPKLVRHYASHPLLVTGLSVLLLSHGMTLALGFLPKDHQASRVLIILLNVFALTVMAGALPFLFVVSQFLRPSYFMPMLTRKGLQSLQRMSGGRSLPSRAADLFETIDVVTNVALTGMSRGDRQLVLLALEAHHAILTEIILSVASGRIPWHRLQPRFTPGLAVEGQEHLTRRGVWPEAYVLAQMLKILEQATRRQHEISAELASHLVQSTELAVSLRRESVVQLHVMAFNTLVREAAEERDLRRFQNLSYHYRLLVEVLCDVPDQMFEATRNLLHYGKLATREGLRFAMETVVYDLGELILRLGRRREDASVQLLQGWVGPLWQECIDEGALRKVAWRTLVRTYWEVHALGLESLGQAIYWRFLSDEAVHREQLEVILEENRELHYEMNDRLMRFAYMSPAAAEAAQAFLQDL